MDSQNPQGKVTPPEGNRLPPPPPGVPGISQGGAQHTTPPQQGEYSAPITPPGGSPQYWPSQQQTEQPPYPAQPQQGYGGWGSSDAQQMQAYPQSQNQPQPYSQSQQTQSQPAWPPYPQTQPQSQGQPQQGSYSQGQPYSQQPTQPQQSGYPPSAPGSQGGYPQPDYRPTAQGGYNVHEQPTQAYVPGPNQPPPQGGYTGYQNSQGSGYQQGYPPQQAGGQYGGPYNINTANTRKKGTSPAVLGAIIAVAIALMAGGVLLYLFLQPKSSNTFAISGTPQPTSVALAPTTAPGLTPLRSTPTKLPPEPTRGIAQSTAVPVQGGAGFDGTPHDATSAFFNDLKSGKYEDARSLLTPEIALGLDAATLQSLWETLTSTGGSVTVGDATESGDTAEVDVNLDMGFGFAQSVKANLVKQGGRWFLENPLNFGSSLPLEFPTP